MTATVTLRVCVSRVERNDSASGAFHDSFYLATHIIFGFSAYSAIKTSNGDCPWVYTYIRKCLRYWMKMARLRDKGRGTGGGEDITAAKAAEANEPTAARAMGEERGREKEEEREADDEDDEEEEEEEEGEKEEGEEVAFEIAAECVSELELEEAQEGDGDGGGGTGDGGGRGTRDVPVHCKQTVRSGDEDDEAVPAPGGGSRAGKTAAAAAAAKRAEGAGSGGEHVYVDIDGIGEIVDCLRGLGLTEASDPMVCQGTVWLLDQQAKNGSWPSIFAGGKKGTGVYDKLHPTWVCTQALRDRDFQIRRNQPWQNFIEKLVRDTHIDSLLYKPKW